MTKLELDLLKLSEGKSLDFAANYAAIIPHIIEVLKAQNTPEGFEQAYSSIFSPIIKRPYPRLENGDYKYIEIDQGWKLWQAATAQAVPEGFVLVPYDVVDHCMSHIVLAQCHPNNTSGENDVMEMDLKLLEQSIEKAQEQNHD
ncbi:hypothetical protein D3C78_166160 [compost metagenome]